MNNDIYNHLKFKLGTEYDSFEFQVISIPPYEFLENNLSLVSYEYFGDKSKILGITTKHIFLYFNADILMRVELLYRGDKVKALKRKLEELNVAFPVSITLKLYYSDNTDLTVLMYQDKVLDSFYSY
ncbi:hypothetical protein [Chryseobacterium sp.]|uniref:hypothetical protein n=1 Tax=Chryseobacterium sp. TaxID=1871047 RepID=UPI002899EF23|nr:hypothetical protein [Chryseobacterium sp.]